MYIRILVVRYNSMMKLLRNNTLRYILWLLLGTVLVNIYVLYNFFLITENNDAPWKYTKKERLNWTHEMDRFCLKVQKRIENEKYYKQSNLTVEHNNQISPPDFDNDDILQQTRKISYRYSDWQSSPNLPRRLDPCEHQLYIELLIILDHFFRRHSILYMMADGTLLGSYTHHDVLPWDDDVDLRVPSRDRSRIYTLIHRELGHIIKISHINSELGNYDKVYFPWTPLAGEQKWSYPFIDLSYFNENSTHIWRVNYAADALADCSLLKTDIFPLVWRPFGEIWLPAPREPSIVFELIRWTKIGKLYYEKDYSHKRERKMPSLDGTARPDELYQYYPWVERYCLKSYCIEQLLMRNNTKNITIHTVHFKKYRAELFFNPKFESRTCFL